MLSNKIASNEAIALVEDDNVVYNDKKAEAISNNFFSNIIETIGVTQHNETEPLTRNIGDPLMQAIIKSRSQ